MSLKNLNRSLELDRSSAEEVSRSIIAAEKQNVEQNESAWPAYDSGLVSIARRFYSIIEKTENTEASGSFVSYLKKRFEARLGNLVGLELGGNGSNFFKELNIAMGSEQGFKNSYGVTLADHRTPEQKDVDLDCNHEVLESDIYSGNNKQILDKFRRLPAEQRPDFIFESMLMPMGMANYSPSYFYLSANEWFRILRPGGVFLAQCPVEFKGYDIFDANDFFEKLEALKSVEGKYSIRFKSQGRLLKVEKDSECSLPRLRE